MSQPTTTEVEYILDREANRAAIRLIHEQANALQAASNLYDTTLNQIESATLEAARHVKHFGLRHCDRKIWAKEVRRLLKYLGITGISVTAPSYSMASSIDVRLPDMPTKSAPDHVELHDRLWREGKIGIGCPACKARWQAKKKVEAIILVAFPDLDDRSDSRSDLFDFCFTID